MIFVYSEWKKFCERLRDSGANCVTACQIMQKTAREPYVILKHDVETNVRRAYKMAEIEHNCGISGSFYVQAYLLKKEKNIRLLRRIQQMGHEVSYHHDVLDSSGGDMVRAENEFEKNRLLFQTNGFDIVSVCQHGNPIVNRSGYHSNRDFFRSGIIQEKYPSLADIMVNFKEKAQTEYLYFSDAGRKLTMIFDPLTNDIVNSDDKNIVFDSLEDVLQYIGARNGIISIHPHRWASSELTVEVKNLAFKMIRAMAKAMVRIPLLKKLMGKFYFLAKRI